MMIAIGMIGSMSASTREMDDAQNALLLEYAAGSLDEATTLLVASWLALCPRARAEVARYERLGGILMCQDCAPVRMAETSLRTVLGRLEAEARTVRRVAEPPVLPLPMPLHGYICQPEQWQAVCSGVRILDLALPRRYASLVHAGPAAKLEQARARGLEITLVLEGAYSDGQRVYRKGDLVITETATGAVATADSALGCLSLVLSDRAFPKPAGLRRFIQALFKR